eukprot:15459139-Alexandrium_andersonii.AAC.1
MKVTRRGSRLPPAPTEAERLAAGANLSSRPPYARTLEPPPSWSGTPSEEGDRAPAGTLRQRPAPIRVDVGAAEADA